MECMTPIQKLNDAHILIYILYYFHIYIGIINYYLNFFHNEKVNYKEM